MFLADAAVDALAPVPEARTFQVGSHDSDHVGFFEPELIPYRLKRRSVLPGHLNDPIQLSFGELHGSHELILIHLLDALHDLLGLVHLLIAKLSVRS